MKNSNIIILLKYALISSLLLIDITLYQLYRESVIHYFIPGLLFSGLSSFMIYKLVETIKLQWYK